MSGHRILRWEIPIDDADHEVPAMGPVLHVAASSHWTDMHRIEFWTWDTDDPFWTALRPPAFRVFGTGHAIPDGYEWRGTAERTAQGHVWHLLQRTGDPS